MLSVLRDVKVVMDVYEYRTGSMVLLFLIRKNGPTATLQNHDFLSPKQSELLSCLRRPLDLR